jgi:hypothetical protein
MRGLSKESAQKLFLSLVLVLVAVSFLRIHGTDDVENLKRWIQNAVEFGLVQGFAKNDIDYPPLTSLILFAGFRLFSLFGLMPLLTIKLLILLFYVATAVVFWLWTRDYWLTVVLYLSLLVNGLLLGYVDAFMGLPVLLGFWALKERKLWAATLCFGIGVFVKWTTLILLPFVALYILDVQGARGWRRINFRGILFQVVLPAAAIVAIILLVYGIQPIRAALVRGFGHPWLSGDATNFGWIMTHWLHVHQPDVYGPLVEQQAQNIMYPPQELSRVPRVLFWFFYLSTLVAFFWRPKTFANLVYYTLIGTVMYFAFNLGVHENHLYFTVLLAWLLVWLDRRHLFTAAFWALMLNMNMILFYGFEGQLTFRRVVFGVDMPLVFSILIVIYALGMWLTGIWPQPRTQPLQSPSTGG